MAFLLCATLATGARADPISVNLQSSTGGFNAEAASTGWFSFDLGQVTLPGGDAVGTFFFSGLKAGSDYTVSLDLTGLGVDALRFEVLDPMGDGDDRLDPSAQPGYLPTSYSTSNNLDGLSFAQGSGLQRSALFAGGSAALMADEITHRGDILLFSGLSGVDGARVTFGLRDRIGGRGFLVRISALGADPTPSPEPASMLLMGTGLAGLAAAYRRRKATRRA